MTGYLVFTKHDGDEVDATFIPDYETELISIFKTLDNDKSTDALAKYWDNNPEHVRWNTQTLCEDVWPFNDYNIIGTFLFIIY